VNDTSRTLTEEAFAVMRASSGKTARRLLLGAGVLAVLVPALAGCEAGEHAPTLEFHQAAAGTLTTFNDIQISDAFVLGAPDGSALPSGSSTGLFVSLYNNGDTADTLVSATASNASSVTLPGGSVSLPVDSSVDLSGPTPEVVLKNLSQPLGSGGTIAVTLMFQHAGKVTLKVPVEPQSYYWATYSAAPSGTVGSVSPSAMPTVTGASPSGSGQPSGAGANPNASATTSGGAGVTNPSPTAS
jgi:copper(I)-binding protein